MRYALIAAAAFSAVVSAGSEANAFNNPKGGYVFTSGESTELSWDPTTSGTVSLLLQSGKVTTAETGETIASNIDNSGSYTWDVPTDLVKDQKYSIEIIDDSDSSDYNFLPYFTVAGATETASSSASATSTSESSTSTEASTTSTSTSTSSSTSTTSSSSTSSTPTTMSTMTSTSSSSSSSSSTTSDSSSATPVATTSTSAAASTSASASTTAVPTNAAGINRVSGGMLAVAAGAAMLL